MIPIEATERAVLLEFIENERDELMKELELSEAIVGDERTQDVDNEETDIRHALETANHFIEAIEAGRYVMMDTAPICYALMKGERCQNKANYSPVIVAMHEGRPVCQANREPLLLLCAEHATGDMDTFFGDEAWRHIQFQAMEALGGVVLQKADARLMFHQIDTNQIVPSPVGPSIALPKNGR